MAEVIGPEGVPQGDAAGAPAGDGCVAAPVAAGASAFQVDASAERGAGESVGEYGASAVGACVLEEIGMPEDVPDERAQPYGVGGYLGRPAGAGVGHLQVEGDEVESADALPLVEAFIDFQAVLVEELGVEQLLGSRTHCALLLEEGVLFHDTDFF